MKRGQHFINKIASHNQSKPRRVLFTFDRSFTFTSFFHFHLFLSQTSFSFTFLFQPGAKFSSVASRRTREFACLSSSFFFIVFTRTRLTSPSRSGKVAMMRATFHSSLGVLSATKTTSPTRKLRRFPVHLRRC